MVIKDMVRGICVHCGRTITENDLECYDEDNCIGYILLSQKEW